MSCEHTATGLSLASTRTFREFVEEICQKPEIWLTIQKKNHCTTSAKLLKKKLAAGCGDMVLPVIKLAISGSEGAMICRPSNSWEWSSVEYVARRHLEVTIIDSNVTGRICWRRKTCELFKPHTMPLRGNPHATEWGATLGKHCEAITVFFHTCWGIHSCGHQATQTFFLTIVEAGN